MNMATLETILLVLLVADAIALAALVLVQQGKGADVGAAFGSGGANTVFGSAGSASFLTRMTAWLSIGFFLIAFGLAYTAKERAAELQNIGVPQVRDTAPREPTEAAGQETEAVGQESEAAGQAAEDEERLTTPAERVDSDIPDV